MWALVAIKGGGAVGEDIGKSPDPQTWGADVHLTVAVAKPESHLECDWPQTAENRRRIKFCSKYEGYGALCQCANPLPLAIKPLLLAHNNIEDIPVTVIASNRPFYLFRMLRRLLAVPGAHPAMITVFVDGFFQEPVEVTELFGIRAVQVKSRWGSVCGGRVPG
jgi:beta-1,2-N-acetylglucosaminyltransferase